MSEPTNEQKPQRSEIGIPYWVVGLLALAAVGLRTLANSSVWSHIACGRWIASHGIPHHTTFSFALPANTPWVNTTWLYDLTLASLWTKGHSSGVTLVHILMAVTGFGLLAGAAHVRKSLPWAVGLALGLVAWMMLPGFVPEPMLLVPLFLGLFQFGLSSTTNWRWARIVLPVVQIVWANTHPTFLFGPLIALVSALDSYLDERRGEQPAIASRAQALLAGGLLLATFINPYVAQLHVAALRLLTDASRSISLDATTLWSGEFAPTAFTWSGYVCVGIVALGLLFIAQRISVVLAAPAILGAYLAFRTHQLLPLSAALALPFLIQSLSALGRAFGGIGLPARLAAFALPGLMAWAALSGTAYERLGLAAQPRLGLEESTVPLYAAMNVLGDPAYPARAFNLGPDGGFLAARLPTRSIYADTRGDLYGVRLHEDLTRALRGHVETQRRIEAATPGVDGIVINAMWTSAGDVIRSHLASGRWALVYFDGTTAVLTRNSLRYASLIRNRQLQHRGLDRLEAARKSYAASLRHTGFNGNDPRMIGAGHVFLALAMNAQAEAVYSLLVQGAPHMASSWMGLGLSRLRQMNFDGSLMPLRKAADMRPGDAYPLFYLAQALKAAGRVDEANEVFQRASGLKPEPALLKAATAQFQAIKPQNATPRR